MVVLVPGIYMIQSGANTSQLISGVQGSATLYPSGSVPPSVPCCTWATRDSSVLSNHWVFTLVSTTTDTYTIQNLATGGYLQQQPLHLTVDASGTARFLVDTAPTTTTHGSASYCQWKFSSSSDSLFYKFHNAQGYLDNSFSSPQTASGQVEAAQEWNLVTVPYGIKSFSSMKFLDGSTTDAGNPNALLTTASSPTGNNSLLWAIHLINGTLSEVTFVSLLNSSFLDGRNASCNEAFVTARPWANDPFATWNMQTTWTTKAIGSDSQIVFTILSLSSDLYLDGRNSDTVPAIALVGSHGTWRLNAANIYYQWFLVPAGGF